MRTDFHIRVERILDESLKVEPDQRTHFIRSSCRGDAELFQETLTLLPFYESTLQQDAAPPAPEWLRPGATTCSDLQTDDAGEEINSSSNLYGVHQSCLLRSIGRGGMGEVYKAEQVLTGRITAVKFLRKDLRSAEGRRRFALEAELLRHLNHPGIARFYFADTLATEPYFVMEYIKGRSITEHAEHARLSLRGRLALIARVCEALDYAHQRGIVHRDLKPANILVDTTGQPKILDFGIADLVEGTLESPERRAARFVGTREYASPEQLAADARPLTPASDVFAMGIIAHELLVGGRPRRIGRQLQLNFTSWIGLDRAERARESEFLHFLARIIAAALRQSKRHRYATAGQLGADIERILRRYPDGGSAPSHAWLSRLISAGRSSFSTSPLSSLLRTVVRCRITSNIRSRH